MKTWNSKDARSCFAELMKRALADEPQRITGDDRRAVVVLDEAEYRRLRDGAGAGKPAPRGFTGKELIELFRDSPLTEAIRAGDLPEDWLERSRELTRHCESGSDFGTLQDQHGDAAD